LVIDGHQPFYGGLLHVRRHVRWLPYASMAAACLYKGLFMSFHI
jgi:hypothetical protein